MNFYRDTFAQIDLTQFEENIKRIKNVNGKQMIAVIKANAYGHGASYIARKVMELGAVMLAVSSLDEAITLRHDGIDAPILCVGYTRPRDVSLAMFYNITLTVPSLEWCNELEKIKPEGKLKVHLAYDTGMNRIGMKTIDELKECITTLHGKYVCIDGIFTHYTMSDADDEIMTNDQYRKFKEVVVELQNLCNFTYIHASNSDATMHYKEDITNAVRIGLVMFGISSFDTEVKPILSLYTRLSRVKKVNKGEGIGYSQTYTMSEDGYIGTIPIGYADGWIRKNQDRSCYIGKEACRFVGRICMDQAMILLDKEYPVDTPVELIGPHVSLVEMAKELDTIPYEIMCLLTDRVPRVYLENGEVVAIDNPRMRYSEAK